MKIRNNSYRRRTGPAARDCECTTDKPHKNTYRCSAHAPTKHGGNRAEEQKWLLIQEHSWSKCSFAPGSDESQYNGKVVRSRCRRGMPDDEVFESITRGNE